jgi:hypothetical protein
LFNHKGAPRFFFVDQWLRVTLRAYVVNFRAYVATSYLLLQGWKFPDVSLPLLGREKPGL